jgi:hypothetical protein
LRGEPESATGADAGVDVGPKARRIAGRRVRTDALVQAAAKAGEEEESGSESEKAPATHAPVRLIAVPADGDRGT